MKWLTAIFLLIVPSLCFAQGTITVDGEDYTYTDHPRVFLDGPAGTITARVKDPDGAGEEVAPQATDLNPAFVALKNQIRSCVGDSPPCGSLLELDVSVPMMALDWYMDNSQTDSLAAAKYWINNFETVITNGYEFGCDVQTQYCGVSSWADWPSGSMPYYALAYTLIQDQLTAGEKSDFAAKMLNDVDVSYEDGTCTDQLQLESGAVANYTTGTTTVTGSGLSGLTAGRKIYIKPAATTTGGWGTIETVDSDAEITLTGTLQQALGGNYGTVSGGTISELKPWDSSTCGLSWMLKNHYGPRKTIGHYVATTTSSPITAIQTDIPVVDPSTFPSTYPYYISLNGEIVSVSGKDADSFTVTRGQLGTTAKVLSGGKPVFYNRYLPNGSAQDEPTLNLVVQKLSGYMSIALALLDEEPTLAEALLDESATECIDRLFPHQKDMWTGFQQGGSSGYGPGRQISETTEMAFMLAQLSGSPSLDYTSGNWLTAPVYYTIYGGLPGTPETIFQWGQPSVATEASYYHQQWGMFLQEMYDGSDEAAYFNYWQRTASSQFTSSNLTSGSNERLIPFSLLYQLEADTETDYTSLPLYHAFNEIDGTADVSLDAWITRSGWSASTDTFAFMSAWTLSYTTDHIGNGAPGAYKVWKNGWLMSENNRNNTGEKTDTNMLLFGGANNLKASAATMETVLTKGTGGTGWSYAEVDATNAYTATAAATRASRHMVHFTPAGGQDFIVVYDDMASSSGNTKSQNLHYDEAATTFTYTMPNVVARMSDRSLLSNVVYPSGTGIATTYTGLTYAKRLNVCASSDGSTCDATNTAADFLIVHQPSTNAAATLPTITGLATIDSDFRGVEIDDASDPAVAVFPKVGGTYDATSFTTTHSGTAQYVVTGLEAGTYDVTLSGTGVIVNDYDVDVNGVLSFTSTAGAFSISYEGAPAPPPEITTSVLPSGTVGVAYDSGAQAATGGTTPYVWSCCQSGALPTGTSINSSTGAITGTPSADGTFNFTERVTEDGAATGDKAQSIVIATNPGLPVVGLVLDPGTTGVVAHLRASGMAADATCTVSLSDGESTFDSVNVNSGPASRTVTFTGLTADTTYSASAICDGTADSGQIAFSTLTSTGAGNVTHSIALKPNAILTTVAKVRASYAVIPLGIPEFSSDVDCASGCTVDLTLAKGSTYGIKHYWLTSGGTVIAPSEYRYVAVH